ncbi:MULTISPECIES: NAD-dependent epimerase/dehydratase family protein [Empedobacter]|uniref:NAD-dependent epimerase/dehydratase family protein n=1 Tax=Empedobacter falsenii TaxID=343874 RepID=A0A3R8SKS0_9FLAO|nr:MULTISPECIES: NAD-dependent epimerase/dehydratase family protein [Empedobacter]MBY0066670.1 NAD-dependent epimerase/dehydratase family protein [Empedobacter falsenii]MDH0659657.1 NAD-dependent epimerase/dehydratase family protein [Empedobacter sp. GD03865]MDH0675325.1 NAD-dependent epimerase/dehydratase family protein [Empedobacter sp. GD03861]RRT89838.1 NAD-dependent epimerase/dehydratase family protein [Empedobacter falsenii]RRT89841.1 NAD-dependent epimerase/dehydratase family protein [E
METDTILITGALGQIGSELAEKLKTIHGKNNVIISDIRDPKDVDYDGIYEVIDVMDADRIKEVIAKHNIKTVYHLAALLSGTAEKNPMFGWKLNMDTLLTFLELAKDKVIDKIFWPSSIGVFGPDTPKDNTPQNTIQTPSTVYGISKLSGEYWCKWYQQNHNVDVRSVRFPGLISWKTPAGGGTTDYAVDIYYKAIEDGKYTSFLKEGTYLPMLYMDDAINAIIELMSADPKQLGEFKSYNLGGLSFAPEHLAAEIKKHIPNFTIDYAPDFRQAIADSWPSSIDDSVAKADWGFEPKFDIDKMTTTMLDNLKIKLGKA